MQLSVMAVQPVLDSWADEFQRQWKWAFLWEPPKKLPLDLKEEMEVCASGFESHRSRARKGISGGGTVCAARQREEHRNSLVRIEWRLCGVLRAAERMIQKACRATQ